MKEIKQQRRTSNVFTLGLQLIKQFVIIKILLGHMSISLVLNIGAAASLI